MHGAQLASRFCKFNFINCMSIRMIVTLLIATDEISYKSINKSDSSNWVQCNFDGWLFIHWAWIWFTCTLHLKTSKRMHKIARQTKYFRCIHASTINLRCHHHQFSAIKRKFTFNPNIKLFCSKFEKKMWMWIYEMNRCIWFE